jgi:hypothetical protein
VDAIAHYTTAIELARLTGDVFWHAGALEGSVCALVVSFYIKSFWLLKFNYIHLDKPHSTYQYFI